MVTNRKGRQLHFWLGMIVSLACLGAIFVFIKPADIVNALREARYGYLLVAALALCGFMILRAVRWQFMLNSGRASQSRVPYSSVFHIQNIGYLLTNILPFRAGDVARAVLIGNVPPISISQGLSTMVVERVFDLLFIVMLFPFTLASVGELPPEVRAAVRLGGFMAITATLILIVAANQRPLAGRLAVALLDRVPFLNTETWARRLDDLLLGLGSLTRLKDGILLLLLSVAVWLPIIAGYLAALRAVNLEPTLAEAAFTVCIAAFSVTAPSSPGQVGVFEAAVTFGMVSILGYPEAESASFAFLYHAINYLIMGILGAVGINRTSATLASVIASARTVVSAEPKKDEATLG